MTERSDAPRDESEPYATDEEVLADLERGDYLYLTPRMCKSLAAIVRAAQPSERGTLEDENFALAANQCLHGLKGDEGGTPYCPRIKELTSALKDLLEQVESLDSYGLTCDTETYKAQANWDDAIRRAADALGREPAWQPHPEATTPKGNDHVD